MCMKELKRITVLQLIKQWLSQQNKEKVSKYVKYTLTAQKKN